MEVREHANSTEWLLKLLNIHSIGHGDIGCIKKKKLSKSEEAQFKESINVKILTWKWNPKAKLHWGILVFQAPKW